MEESREYVLAAVDAWIARHAPGAVWHHADRPLNWLLIYITMKSNGDDVIAAIFSVDTIPSVRHFIMNVTNSSNDNTLVDAVVSAGRLDLFNDPVINKFVLRTLDWYMVLAKTIKYNNYEVCVALLIDLSEKYLWEAFDILVATNNVKFTEIALELVKNTQVFRNPPVFWGTKFLPTASAESIIFLARNNDDFKRWIATNDEVLRERLF